MASCLAAHWQRKLMKEESEGTLTTLEPAPTAWLTEAQALRECLWLLRGTNLKSPVFIVRGVGRAAAAANISAIATPLTIKPNPKFCLTSLTPMEWDNVVAIYGHYGIIRHRIDSFLKKVLGMCDDRNPSAVGLVSL